MLECYQWALMRILPVSLLGNVNAYQWALIRMVLLTECYPSHRSYANCSVM